MDGDGTAMNQHRRNLDADGKNEADQEIPAPKRKKLRKGTQSCWECKRRKARCTFPENEPGACEGCRRRGSKCISQDLPDQPSTGTREDLSARLGQVETRTDELTDLLAQFIQGSSSASLEKLLSQVDNPGQNQPPNVHAKDAALAEGFSAEAHHQSQHTVRIPLVSGMPIKHMLILTSTLATAAVTR